MGFKRQDEGFYKISYMLSLSCCRLMIVANKGLGAKRGTKVAALRTQLS